MVFHLQSHDEVGNRPLGDRLHGKIGLAASRAATAILLCAPQTPMLFMGEEWAADTPFLFFTDHKPGIGQRVTDGRRRLFHDWRGFRTARALERIPDPQAESTFLASKLDWSEPSREPHAGMLRYMRALIAFRRAEPALLAHDRGDYAVRALGRRSLALTRTATGRSPIVVVAELAGNSVVDLARAKLPAAGSWTVVLTSEDPDFASDPDPVRVATGGAAPVIQFARPGAVILRGDPA